MSQSRLFRVNKAFKPLPVEEGEEFFCNGIFEFNITISHNAEGGYQQILDTITDGIQQLASSDHPGTAIELAEYALQVAKRVAEKFAEGCDWSCAISRLVELAEELEHA